MVSVAPASIFRSAPPYAMYNNGTQAANDDDHEVKDKRRRSLSDTAEKEDRPTTTPEEPVAKQLEQIKNEAADLGVEGVEAKPVAERITEINPTVPVTIDDLDQAEATVRRMVEDGKMSTKEGMRLINEIKKQKAEKEEEARKQDQQALAA